jgi:hypothetical protein
MSREVKMDAHLGVSTGSYAGRIEAEKGDAARYVQNCTLSGMELEKVVAGAPIGTQRCDEA